MRNIIIITIITSIILVACNVTEQTNKQLLVKNITLTEQSLFDTISMNLNIEAAKKLVIQYEGFAKEYSTDSLTPIYLLKAADVSISTRNYNNAVELYSKVYKNYSNYAKAPEALFMQAMVYSDFLKNESLAKQKYQEFIEKYPNHELTDDAKISIEFLGKTPEEILQIIEAKDSLSNK